jgi:hypothetical protein
VHNLTPTICAKVLKLHPGVERRNHVAKVLEVGNYFLRRHFEGPDLNN